MLHRLQKVVPYRANRNYAAFLNTPSCRKEDGSMLSKADIAALNGICRRVAASDRLPDVGRGNVAAGTVGFVGTIFGEKGLWIVDPIDGTNNFVNGLPHFAVSVALSATGVRNWA